MSTRRDARGLVDSSVSLARPWLVGSGLAAVGSAFGLIGWLYAVASLLAGDLRHSIDGPNRWLVLAGAGLIVQAGCAYTSARMAARGADAIAYDLRRAVLSVLVSEEAPEIGSAAASRLLVEDTRRLADAAARWEPLRLQAILVPGVFIAFVFATNWFVGALLFAAAPFIPINMAVFGMGADRLSKRQAATVAELDEFILDRIKGADTLRSFDTVNSEVGRVGEAADQLGQRTMAVLRVALMSSAALEALVTYAVAMAA